MNTEPLLSLLQASKIYQTGESIVHALDNATLNIMSGELIGIFGPSGSGKTTLLMIVGLLDSPTVGQVMFKGKVVSWPGIELNRLRDYRRDHIGFVFQKPNLIPFLTAEQNVRIALQINNVDKAFAEQRSRYLLEQFGMRHRANNFPKQLSGGEQQRVAIARALANRPKLILADEPTANLDSVRGRQIMTTFRELADREGVSICVVTHDTRCEDLFDRRVEISDGRITRQ